MAYSFLPTPTFCKASNTPIEGGAGTSELLVFALKGKFFSVKVVDQVEPVPLDILYFYIPCHNVAYIF
jgi:hypothetical protein